MAEIKLDYGLNIAAKVPVDKRIVVNSLADLYNKSTFDYVYAGLTVSVLNSVETEEADVYGPGTSLWILADVAPYEFGSTIELSKENFTTYWQKVNGSSNEEANGVIYWWDLDADEEDEP